MWKDPMRGLREIPCDEGSQGVLLEVELDRVPRYAADGRAPVDDVADFRLAEVHQLAARPSGAPVPPAPPPRPATAEPGLDQAELSVLSAWARAVAHAVVVGPSVGDVLAQAGRGARWRAAAGAPEPSDGLQAALDMLGRAAAAASEVDRPDGRPSVRAMQQAVEAAAAPGDPVSVLACTVLAAKLERFAAQALPAPRRAPTSDLAEHART
jgi:hypothetical protein